ncbi:SDR family NAD(P)-dependent oxidoreductase [Pelagicoccus mobilis]|uniref:Glucose 1-dehydrogenase n=1 Tax=Pelagicoccus mobilis TaxID=415221 RepID=A0A934VRF3_9BACT|nr:glucose 1-dehydrogenase [Pelagicoccus mobilis]MBK1877568.1 glucose 1-dehydrogenase [Pelagicoccus mobilis]
MGSQRFEGRVAIVTGAAHGIGFAIAERLFAEGAKVVLNDLDPAAADTAARSMDEDGERCIAFAGDAGDPDLVKQLVAFAVERFGRLDLVVANAGLTTFNTILDIEPDALRRMLDLNIQGSVFLAKYAAERMVAQGDGGRIVFMSSVTGHQAHDNVVCYGMTKAALRMLAKGLVVELAQHGITTNAVSPGATVTERTLRGDPRLDEKWSEKTPTGRATRVEDIAAATLFLLSDEAAQITGQSLVVDGGWSSTSETPDFGLA